MFKAKLIGNHIPVYFWVQASTIYGLGHLKINSNNWIIKIFKLKNDFKLNIKIKIVKEKNNR